MPKRGKEPRPSSRHSGGRFSPPPQPPRQPRNDYQIAGSSRSTCDSSSGRRSPHIKDNIKKSNGIVHPGNTPRILMRVVNSPIILTDDDDDDDNVYKNLDTSVNIFRENGNKLKPDTGEGASIVKHFVPSADRYHMSQSAPEKPVFRGPETDVLHDLGNDKLKIIRVQMIRADIQQNDSFRKAYVVEDSVAGNRSKDKNHQNFEERQVHFNQNNQQIHYDNDKNYGMAHPMSPSRLMSRDQSLSPRVNMVRPPSPPLPYSPERDHFNSDNNMLRRDRPKRSPERNVHDRPPRPEHFLEQLKMDNFSSGPPPEPRSPEMQRFRPGDHNRHRVKDDPIHYEERPRHSGSPVYFENHYQYNRSMSPNNRQFSPNHEQQLPITPPSLRELSSPLRDRPPHPNERPRRRRTPPPRRDRSRERRRRISPRRRTPPPPVRSPIKRRENGKKRGPNKNQEARKREAKERKRRSQSKPKSAPQQQQQNPFQQPQPQPMYPPPPPPGVVRMPPRPFPPGPMMIPLRPPPFPPPMGAWRPPRPMPAPPSGWPYPHIIRSVMEGAE
ncbi:serine/arginine repetitive matrix protein 1-like isoform X4 [Metopolophium dirhodum]|uniref:serine/arginine repetitive matrix protein 1-like isoform X4 n=1 Tax=Metopolophium dirhodum TaxID=44670 RepID=UPI0029902AAC|nr:serine/arginine repetitive matrix protein 1-like isoform X4 [Metopolophium dirhodum]